MISCAVISRNLEDLGYSEVFVEKERRHVNWCVSGVSLEAFQFYDNSRFLQKLYFIIFRDKYLIIFTTNILIPNISEEETIIFAEENVIRKPWSLQNDKSIQIKCGIFISDIFSLGFFFSINREMSYLCNMLNELGTHINVPHAHTNYYYI